MLINAIKNSLFQYYKLYIAYILHVYMGGWVMEKAYACIYKNTANHVTCSFLMFQDFSSWVEPIRCVKCTSGWRMGRIS